jgi:hypothetical protein
MSLIRVRRERKETIIGPGRPPRLWVQVAKLAVVLAGIYYLGQLF